MLAPPPLTRVVFKLSALRILLIHEKSVSIPAND
jgi:hypothetical protein